MADNSHEFPLGVSPGMYMNHPTAQQMYAAAFAQESTRLLSSGGDAGALGTPTPAMASVATFVNAKQFKRILKRRIDRERLEAFYKKDREKKRSYKHESRHKHAAKRPRGPKGRFLTKEELVEYYKENPQEDPDAEK